MKATAGIDYRNPPPPEKLKEDGYQIVNAEYGLSANWIRAYHSAGLWVNLYTVDEPWQFSRLWLLGVDSITTSNAQAMVGLEQPMWSLPYSVYLSLWGLVGFLGVLIILGMTLRGFRNNQKVESSEG